MHDPRPLSERFDLTYVHKPHLSDRWTGRLSIVVILLMIAMFGGMAMLNDQRAYSSGPLTSAHAMFADDCGKCHAPDPDRSGYWLPSRDELCLNCHVAPLHAPHQSMFIGDVRSVGGEQVVMSSSCSVCHIEHQGAHANLSHVPDITCVGCHQDLQRFGWNDQGAHAHFHTWTSPALVSDGGHP